MIRLLVALLVLSTLSACGRKPRAVKLDDPDDNSAVEKSSVTTLRTTTNIGANAKISHYELTIVAEPKSDTCQSAKFTEIWTGIVTDSNIQQGCVYDIYLQLGSASETSTGLKDVYYTNQAPEGIGALRLFAEEFSAYAPIEALAAFFDPNNIGFSVPDAYDNSAEGNVVVEKSTQEFDLTVVDVAEVAVSIEYRPDPTMYRSLGFCGGVLFSDVDIPGAKSPLEWQAVSGKVKITIDKHPSGDPACYVQSVELNDITFHSDAWDSDLTIDHFSFGEVVVDTQWYSGVENCGNK